MIQTMRTTIQSVLFMLTLALFGPVAASAAQGEFVVATRAANVTTLTAGQWVRFAESGSGVGNNAGVFDIRWTGTGIGGHVRVSIGANSNDETQIGMVLNDASSQGAPAIGKVRLLEGAAGTTMYLEAYVNVALSSLEFVHEAGYGWALVGPTPTLSTTLTTHELDTTGAFAVNEGSKSFMVTKDGKVGIGTTTPGQKLSVAGTIESSSGFKFPDGTTQTSSGTAAGWTENTGANTVYVTTTGRTVGIGTTGPKNKLDVEGGLVVGATYSGTNTAPANGLLVEGNTGIGTTTPVNKLDVEGGLAVGATYSGTNAAPTNGLLVEGNTGIGTANPGGMINGGSYFKPDLSGLNVDILSKNNEAVLNLRSNQDIDNAHIGGLYFTRDAGQSDAHRQIASIQGRQDGTGTLAGGELWFFTKPINTAVGIDVARMMIGQSGNVGIGTTTPVNKLDVEGGLAVGVTYSGTNAVPANGLLVEGNTGIGTTTPVNKLDVEGGLAVGATYSGTNAAPTNGLLVEGKVGIGTTAPVNKLDVEGGLAVGATYSGTNTAPANGLLVEGNTGIGTTAPVNKLDVEGGLAVGATYSGTNVAPANGLLVEGNVGIGTTTPSDKLDINGTLKVRGWDAVVRSTDTVADPDKDHDLIGTLRYS